MSPAIADGGMTLTTPALTRRLACLVYEGVLLFGVLMLTAFLFSTITQQRHALVGRHALQAFVFVVLGIYFTWFWSHGGQTVAMKAWHIRLVGPDGLPVTQRRAALRYVLCWLWFLPSLAVLYLSGFPSPAVALSITALGVVGYAALALVHPQRQFWHDALSRTRLVTTHAVHRPG